MPFGYGLTLYKLVFIAISPDSNVPYLKAHEAEHVRQWTETGFFKFIYLYFKESYDKGYHDNKYEVQARNMGVINSHLYK